MKWIVSKRLTPSHVHSADIYFEYLNDNEKYEMEDTSVFSEAPTIEHFINSVLELEYAPEHFVEQVLSYEYPKCHKKVEIGSVGLDEQLVNKCNWKSKKEASTKNADLLGPSNIYYRILESPDGDEYIAVQVFKDGAVDGPIVTKTYFSSKDISQEDLLLKIRGFIKVKINFADGSNIILESTQSSNFWALEINEINGDQDSIAKKYKEFFTKDEGTLKLENKIDRLLKK